MAVERAQLRDTAAVRLSRLEAQRVIERHISEQLDTEELLVVIARSAQRLIGGTFSALYLLEGDTLRPRAWSDIPDWIRDLRFKIGSGVAGAALASGRGVLANDYPSSPGAMAEFIPFTSRLLAAPLMAGDRPLGVMTAGRGPGAPAVHRGGSLDPDRLRHAGRGGARARAALRRGHPQRGPVPGAARGERRGQLDPRRRSRPRPGAGPVPGAAGRWPRSASCRSTGKPAWWPSSAAAACRSAFIDVAAHAARRRHHRARDRSGACRCGARTC